MITLKTKKQKILYAFGAFGVNLLNLIVGSYLCAGLILEGFAEKDILNHTYAGKDLVIVALWGVFTLIAKILDGVIDIPMASLTDNLKSKFGRRRPSLIIGMVPMIIAYLLFLVIPTNKSSSLFNTIYYAVILCLFYTSYTLTMVTYYSTYSEIVDNQKDRQFISNVKAVADILYFILGFVGVVAMLNGFNVRIVGLMVLPLVFTMLIPLFMIKEPSNLEDSKEVKEYKKEKIGLFKSIAKTFSNKSFIIWMVVSMLLTFSSQLFLGGISPYFSATGMSMIYVMLAAFLPVPFTIRIFNVIQRKKGFGWAIRYTLFIFGLAMLALYFVSFIDNHTLKTILSIIGGLISSLSIGSIFSVSYSVPSELAADEKNEKGDDNSAMYFAIQGLFSGVATGLATGIVLNSLRNLKYGANNIVYLTLICGVVALIGVGLTFILPKKVQNIGIDEDRKFEI